MISKQVSESEMRLLVGDQFNPRQAQTVWIQPIGSNYAPDSNKARADLVREYFKAGNYGLTPVTYIPKL